ncbi:MAG: DUF2141 domain-containing protein [Bacteroidia bacterium]|nr:DUF2141 domain-containing protein [Bacteroidia bacterium]MBT8311151.1 DUF2141 domain-containing protein [Bacteroidia bacterium]NNK27899.1 DUF2141 domain-containing protein [Flavobacteriaceae bacterium]NNL61715.1 DUF2141 domain-containing protein [Flavobacteriaceae bacterium]
MKTIIYSFALLISSICLAQETKGITIEIDIDNISNNEGKVLLSLHTSETFMKGLGVMNTESKIINGKINVTFENVQPGVYAVMALHDKNENNRMDYDANGMPKENYGSSNNPMSYGPPQFSESKFEVDNEDLKMNIRF